MAEKKGLGTEDRLAHLDAALKECIQQISTLQEEREVESELKEANKRLVCTLVCKQELVEELEREKQQLEAELDALVTRVDSVEKENAFLKCECCALERDLVLHLDSANKVEKLEEECVQLRHLVQRKLNGNPVNGALAVRELSDNSSRKIDILVDRLCDVEEENKVLREIIQARENELCSSKLKCAQMAYRLAVIEAELKDVGEGDNSKLPNDQLSRSCLDNSKSSDQLCTGVLQSELEYYPTDNARVQEDCTRLGASKNSLINHFIKDSDSQMEPVGKQIVPVLQAHAKERSIRTNGCWPWNALHEIMEEHQSSKRSIAELLEEIKISLAPQSCKETVGVLPKPGGSNLTRSICRMIELIEEISPSSIVGSSEIYEDQAHIDTDLDYSVHVFRWKKSELLLILQKFVLSCSLVLNGSHELDEFMIQMASLLEWAVGNCVPLEDVSSVRDRIRNHSSLDRSKSESETGVTFGDCQNVMTKMVKIQSDLQEQNTWLNHKLESLESGNKELEAKLRSAMQKNELLMTQLEESKESIARLEEDLDDLHDSKDVSEDQIEHQKYINEDLDTQLTVAKVKQNELMQRLSSLEIELEDRNQCCEDLETTCLELQLQLEIFSRKGSPSLEDQLESEEHTGWEMITDCTKLALIRDACMENTPTEQCDISGTNFSVKKFAEKDKGIQHHSLRSRMLADNKNSKIIERVCAGETVKETEPVKIHPDSVGTGALALVPMKKQGGGFGFIRKMFFRRRKCSTKKASSTLLQRNASTMMR